MPETSLKSVQTLTSKSFRIVAEAAHSRKLSPTDRNSWAEVRLRGGLAWLRMSRRFGSRRLTRWHDRRKGRVSRGRERPAPHELLHMLRHFPINAVADLARQLPAPVESLLDQRLIGGRLPVTVDLLEQRVQGVLLERGFIEAADKALHLFVEQKSHVRHRLSEAFCIDWRRQRRRRLRPPRRSLARHRRQAAA